MPNPTKWTRSGKNVKAGVYGNKGTVIKKIPVGFTHSKKGKLK